MVTAEHTQKIKNGEGVWPATGEEVMAVISEAMLSLNKGRMAVLFREPTHICMGKYFAGGNIPKHSSLKCVLLNMVNLRVDVKKEKWQIHYWAC